jgi:hypothetical protein
VIVRELINLISPISRLAALCCLSLSYSTCYAFAIFFKERESISRGFISHCPIIWPFRHLNGLLLSNIALNR